MIEVDKHANIRWWQVTNCKRKGKYIKWSTGVVSVFHRNYLRGTYYKSIASSDSWIGAISRDSCPGSRTRRRDVWSSVTPAYHSAALNYPPADRSRVVRDFLAGMPITRSACWLLCVRGKKCAWSTRSVNISLKTTFIFYDAKKIVCIKSETSVRSPLSSFLC